MLSILFKNLVNFLKNFCQININEFWLWNEKISYEIYQYQKHLSTLIENFWRWIMTIRNSEESLVSQIINLYYLSIFFLQFLTYFLFVAFLFTWVTVWVKKDNWDINLTCCIHKFYIFWVSDLEREIVCVCCRYYLKWITKTNNFMCIDLFVYKQHGCICSSN